MLRLLLNVLESLRLIAFIVGLRLGRKGLHDFATSQIELFYSTVENLTQALGLANQVAVLYSEDL